MSGYSLCLGYVNTKYQGVSGQLNYLTLIEVRPYIVADSI